MFLPSITQSSKPFFSFISFSVTELYVFRNNRGRISQINGTKPRLVQTIKLYLTMEESKGKEKMVTIGESTDRNRLKVARILGVTISVLSQVVQRRRKWKDLWKVR